ncbi:MAG TPA: ferric reductase-like transmembrane domain-containing protein [Acidimicrobiales bacterium]|nr:ferric reductase-like transmembrane domain-containing protein [Acidimicrobiales bacterium]
MDSKLIWYTARASGLVTWALLAASVLWGLALSSRSLRNRLRQAWLVDLHRFLGGVAVVFLTVHVTSIVLDTYVHFGIIEVLVPFTGSWHPAAVAWGVAGLYLLLALEVTSMFRARLPKRLWRLTHYASFPLFAVATVHGLTAGTDRHTLAMQAGFIGVAALVTLLAAFRMLGRSRSHNPLTAPVPPALERSAA